MPDRPGLDDDLLYLQVLDLWAEAQADLDHQLEALAADLARELARGDELRVDRLRAKGRRLDDLRAQAVAITDDAAQQTRRWIEGGGIHRTYRAGAATVTGPGYSFTQPDRAAIEVIARQTWADILAATNYVDTDSKRWVARVARQVTARKITTGRTLEQTARAMERALARQLGRAPGTIRYANGARHGIGHYADMIVRTRTAIAYNAGTVNTARQVGIEMVEILDGTDCGLTAHNDPVRASGLLVPLQVANDWPIGHPNCRRAFAPRPDLTPADADRGFESVVSPEARADQTAFENALRAQATRPRTAGARRTKAPKQPAARRPKLPK